jgi:hypothetical protein
LLTRKQKNYSPQKSAQSWSTLLLLLMMMYILEVFRVPFLLLASVTNGYTAVQLHTFFSDFNEMQVVRIGMTITTLAFSVFCLAYLAQNRWKFRTTVVQKSAVFLNINPLIWLLVLVPIVATYLAIQAIGFQEINEDFSSKRDFDQAGGTILTYAYFRLSLMGHIVGALLLYFYISTRKHVYLIACVVLTLIFLVAAIVFSQRQIILICFLEYYLVMQRMGKVSATTKIWAGISCFVIIFALTVFRGTSSNLSTNEQLSLFLGKIEGSRYFLDFTRHGTIMLWIDQSNLQLNLILTPLWNFLWGTANIGAKEIGYLVASNVYWMANPGGVTTGAVLDSIISFGFTGGSIFIFIFAYLFFYTEKKLMHGSFSIILVVFLGKVLIFLNSSFDSFVFAFLIELPLAFAATLCYRETSFESLSARSQRV